MVGQQFEQRDIVLQSHDNTLRRISEIHRSYDALQYPLLFCRGEDGYSVDIPHHNPITEMPLKKTVSAASFYSYRLMVRQDEINHLLYFRSFLSQFLVAMYAKIESERLNFIKNNQAQLRAESYIHLRDAVGRQDADANQLGQIVIDDVICAEIPDLNKDPLLYDIVKSNMIHGPCGSINHNSPLMKEGRCSKRYPRPLRKDTQTGDDGYPQYRRRSPSDGGFIIDINGMQLDNRWVVPYNPVLSRTFNAHINIEYCNSVKSINL
ncbi:hypothetical protein RF55_6535 [Lasius niger]|uniref:Helitron helicase-like domain-containing protein n=1 Tax=Lasius niger TaxID=67767 RepID=A0A0J7KSS5_LASNI|nr:hypothetical protein RF55_6535 [Lasius niger]